MESTWPNQRNGIYEVQSICLSPLQPYEFCPLSLSRTRRTGGVLIALPQYVRHSLVLALIAMIGYAAIIVIMTIGSPLFTAPE